MAKLEETNLHILEGIVDRNEGRPGATLGCSIYCGGISCDECPMNGNKRITLETIRDEVTSRTTTQHSVLCSYETSRGKQPCDCVAGDALKPVFPEEHAKTIEGVTKPSHYALFDGIESIEVIARSMSLEMFRGFCFGNVLKYRLRAGKKSELAYAEKDLAKANFYTELFEKHKEKCYDAE